MSGLFDQITNYSPPLLTAGQVNYKGTWSAATNTPTLVSPPAATTKGDYYVVSAAGTQFTISFAVGDWIISNGTAWEKVDLTDAVSSVFGRTGAVVGASTDYSSVGLTNTAIGASSPSTGAFTTVTASSTIAATGAVTGSNLSGTHSGTSSGTNTGDQTITLTGGVTGSGTGSFAATVVTNANLTGDVTSVGNATTLTNAPVIAKVLTGYVSGAGTVAATDSILQAIQKLNGNDATNANLTGAITSVGNATSLGSFSSANLAAALTDETGSGAAVFATSPTLVTPALGTPSAIVLTNASGTASININGTVGATTASTGAFTTLSATGAITTTGGNITRNGSGTAAGFLNVNNTGNDSYFGINNSAGTTFAASAYDTVVQASAGNAVSLSVAGTGAIARATSTGLAVTGTLSANDSGYVQATFQRTAGNGPLLFLKNYSSTTYKNWFIGSGYNGEQLEFMPSTAAGGSTVGAAVVAISSTGLAVTGSLSTTGTITSTTGNNSAILLSLSATTGYQYVAVNSTGAAARFGIENSSGGSLITGSQAYDTFIGTANATGLSLATNGAQRMRIDSSGNVGIGTSSPAGSYKLDVAGNIFMSSGDTFRMKNSSSNFSFLRFEQNSSTAAYTYLTADGRSTGYLSFSTNDAERARIDSSGNLLVGTTSTGVSAGGFQAQANGRIVQSLPSGQYSQINHNSATGTEYAFEFMRSATACGSITTTAAGTQYNTASDYRRKSNVKDLTGSGTFIDALKPRTFDWDTGDKGVGFIAHEFAEVSPSSVAGEKDAVDADGKPIYQGMQASSAEVIANLVAELQSVRQRLAALEAK